MQDNLIDGNPTGSQPSDSSPLANTANGEQITNTGAQTPPEIDEYLEAPKSYKKEYAEPFKTIPYEVRKYIHQREQEMEDGRNKYQERLDSYKWLDDAFAQNQTRLLQSGISNPQQWFGQMALLEKGLSLKPKETIEILAQEFGVPLADTQGTSSPDNALINRIAQLERNLTNLGNAFADQSVGSFAKATDNAGNLIHPHFEAAKNVMLQLLNSGMARTTDEAYDKAIWMIPEIKDKLIAEQTKANLEKQANEAKKAKEAGFDPKGKVNPEERELTTREFLEKQFANLE